MRQYEQAERTKAEFQAIRQSERLGRALRAPTFPRHPPRDAPRLPAAPGSASFVLRLKRSIPQFSLEKVGFHSHFRGLAVDYEGNH